MAHQRHLSAQIFQLQVASIAAIELDDATLGGAEAVDDVEHGAFARAAIGDQTDAGARRDEPVSVIENGAGATVVGEADLLQLHLGTDGSAR